MTAHPKDHYGTFAPIGSAGHVKASGHRRGIYRNSLKRVLDVAAVLITAPFVLPLVLLLAGLVKLYGGDAFYKCRRIGRGGQVFPMLKLCTMVPDADNILASYLEHNPEAAAEWNKTQKLKNDPRITTVGRVLRKTSLDELPQLWNVLVGDMSLVGPRPMMANQRDLYPGTAYYGLRPGVTGPWQVSDRNEAEFADRARFDQEYDDSLSLPGDLSLLLRTVRTVVRGTGY